MDQPSLFDFYDGGGLDVAVVGAVEIEVTGNVNVSHFGGRFAGVGGFVNITQNAKRVIFACPFRTGELEVDVRDGALYIVREGREAKSVKRITQVSFHGPSAMARGQEVLYVTEQAVFKLTSCGLKLLETAPGIDLQSHILSRMEFAPLIERICQMPSGILAR